MKNIKDNIETFPELRDTNCTAEKTNKLHEKMADNKHLNHITVTSQNSRYYREYSLNFKQRDCTRFQRKY